MDRRVSFQLGGGNYNEPDQLPEIITTPAAPDESVQTPAGSGRSTPLDSPSYTPRETPDITPLTTPRPTPPLGSLRSLTPEPGSVTPGSGKLDAPRPHPKRSSSKLQMFLRSSTTSRPKHERSKSMPSHVADPSHHHSNRHHSHYNQDLRHTQAVARPHRSVWQRMGQRVQHNLRTWYIRDRWKRLSELDKLREVQKSNLLFSLLYAATPMVMILGSQFLTDEKGEKRVPVLVHQLGFKVQAIQQGKYKHMVRIDLEYGSGPAVIRWSIIRGYRDFVWLKTRLGSDRVGSAAVKKLKQPKLPRPRKYKHTNDGSSLLGRQFGDNDGSGSEGEEIEGADGDGECDEADEHEDGEDDHHNRDDEHQDNGATGLSDSFEQALEDYLKKLVSIYQFRPDINRVLAFLELSHMSIKLAPEYGYHGKEGTLIIRSRASEMGWHVSHLHPKDITGMITRHTPKWVLVRESYIVIVDDICSTKVLEVFMVDPYFEIKHVEENLPDVTSNDRVISDEVGDYGPLDVPEAPEAQPTPSGIKKKSLFLHLTNNSRQIKLATHSDRELRRWQASIIQMKQRTPWARKNRFDSFAPVRRNVCGQWFVDGRDYLWVLSEALQNARDTIYILDWWLSPELYLRRPPEGNQQWRLDRILKRKAEEGVKVFVVVYRNVGAAIPIDSNWTKYSLLNLHPNIHVMRSPHQLNQRQSLFWAHHEKLCVIDSAVAFNGGIDLCYGRWDNFQHRLTDDAPTPFSDDPNEPTQIWPGKDYTNERARDYFQLDHPYEQQLDRDNTPRMPWHDVQQMVVGQPARDLARHFVQRWNYVLRQKLPSRKTPLLLPPPDFSQLELERLGLNGTCEYQVLRSSSDWSLGLKKHEQSIQNAYLKLIQESEHFVYIENQFFVTSTEVDGILVENQIGNALVQRIIRAHATGEAWRAFILIPLLPGFEADVDTNEAAQVRIICQCQYNSISRGPHSIFYRLESLGIRPDQYIHFFSLRKWDKFGKANDSRLVTEILYIHGKCMVVDDRAVIIGSANINERSMRGVRDSELAVCIRDTEVVESKMAGKPWKAAKFAHSLRVRLMREHLGVNLDKLDTVERLTDTLESITMRQAPRQTQHNSTGKSHPTANGSANGSAAGTHNDTANGGPPHTPTHGSSAGGRTGQSSGYTSRANSIASVGSTDSVDPHSKSGSTANLNNQQSPNVDVDSSPSWMYPELHSFNWYAGTGVNSGVHTHKKLSADSRVMNNVEHKADVDGNGYDEMNKRVNAGRLNLSASAPAPSDAKEEELARKIMWELLSDKSITSRSEFMKQFYARLSGQDILRPVQRAADVPLPHVDDEAKRALNAQPVPIDPWAFDDPLDEQFLHDKWFAAAERNTYIYRQVFRCQPDDEVETWKDYKKYQAHMDRFYSKQREDGGPDTLRASGKHAPERVDVHIMEGAVHNPAPENPRTPMDSPEGNPILSRPQSRGTSRVPSRAPSFKEEDEEADYFGINHHAESPKRRHSGHFRPFALNKNASSHSSGGYDPFKDGNSKNLHMDGALRDIEALKKYSESLPGNKKDTEKIAEGSQMQPLQSPTQRPAGITRTARKWDHFEHVLDAQVAEDMLNGITGHLVIFPTEWLNRELDSGNWNFQKDRMAPLEIFD